MLGYTDYLFYQEDIDAGSLNMAPAIELAITETHESGLRGTHLVRGLGRRAILVDIRRSYSASGLLTTQELVSKAAKVAYQRGWKIAYVLNHPVYEDEWLVTNADGFSKWLYDESFRFTSI